MRRGARQTACALASLIGLAGCDSFDFGRLLGGEVPPVPSASAPVAPEPPPAEAARAERLTVVLAGDVNFTGVELASRPDATAGGAGPLDALAALFDGGVRVVHLVSPLTERPVRRHQGYRGSPAAAEVLAKLGIDAVVVANGRAWDAGEPGFLDTLGLFRDVGLSVAGGGRDEAETYRAAQVLAEGWSVAILAVTAAWPYGPLQHHEAREHVGRYDEPRLLAAVKAAKAQHDLVLVAVHGAKSLVEAAAPEDEARARAIVEAGADAVVTTGASLPRRIGWVSGRPVFHGLGNLLGGESASHPWSRRGVVARVTFGAGQRPQVEACPYLVTDGLPGRLAGGKRATEEQIFQRGLERLSEGEGGSRVGRPRRYGCMTVSPLSESPPADAGR